jgi:hypothetical protein
MGMPAWPQRVGRLAPCFRIDRNVHVKGTRAADSDAGDRPLGDFVGSVLPDVEARGDAFGR